MNAFVKKKQGSDNALENYFLELIVQKKTIDREVQEILDIVEHSTLHYDYKILLKRMLFGTENLYFENWGTLQDGLLDAIKTGEVRDDDIEDHGIIVNMVVQLIETVFDIPDESMHAFIMLEQRESVEHDLVILMKRMLDHLEIGLKELISQSTQLSQKKDSKHHSEFIVIQKNLTKLPSLFFETEKDKIAALKNTIFDLYQKFIVEKNSHWLSSLNFSE